MTHRLLVLYGQPSDAAAFDRHYRDVHVPLASAIPGLLSYDYGHPQALGDHDSPYLVATLDFATAEAFDAALASPEGKAAAGDVPNFATGGATLHHLELDAAPLR